MQNQPSWGQRSESFSLILGFPSQRRESTPRRRFFALALARIFAGARWVMFSPKRLRPAAPPPAAASHSMWDYVTVAGDRAAAASAAVQAAVAAGHDVAIPQAAGVAQVRPPTLGGSNEDDSE